MYAGAVYFASSEPREARRNSVRTIFKIHRQVELTRSALRTTTIDEENKFMFMPYLWEKKK
jgi:hypothetical protein